MPSPETLAWLATMRAPRKRAPQMLESHGDRRLAEFLPPRLSEATRARLLAGHIANASPHGTLSD